ncbi:MAG: pitrilysin family protein [Burkholderiales bacterium]
MRLLHALFLLCLSFMAPAWVAAATKPITATTPVPLREVEGVHEYRLANGLQVLLIPDASKPTTTVNVTYRVGSRMEGYGETGMAHLLEHLMFKGTKSMVNVGVELSKRGMQFNGTTSADRTNYYQTFPSNAAQLAWVLKLEAERMTGANVSRRDLDAEMTVVRNEMESGENDAVRILIEKTEATAYQWHNYGKSTIGARSDVEQVSIAHLQAFYRRYYQPDNATLIVAGAFDPAATLREITATLGRLPKPTRVLEPTHTVEPVQDGERLVTVRRVGGQQALLAMYHIPALASRDFAAFEVLANTLTDVPAGRLHKRLVEAGQATDVFGWADRHAEPGLFSVGAVLKKDDALDGAQQLLLASIEGLAAEPVTAAELQRAQRQWANDFDKMLANPQRLCLALSESIAAGDWRLLFALRNRVEALTLDDVNAAARAWLKPANRTLGRFIATEAPDRSPPALPVNAAEALKDFKARAAVAAGETFDARPANLDARTERYTLPSGLKVALLPKQSRGQTVEVALRLHAGTPESLRGKRWAAEFAGDLIGTGTQLKTRAQISEAFDALQTNWSVQGDALQGASAGLSTRRNHLPAALALLGEVLRQPSFPQAEFDQLLRQQISALEQAAQDPQEVATRALRRALRSHYPADDVRHIGTVADDIAALRALQRDAVVEFYRTQWGAQHGELAIVGDFDAAQLKPVIAKLFGDWRSGQAYARVPMPPSSVTGQQLQATLADKPNATLLGALPLALTDTDADFPALSMALHVLGGGGFDSRLLTRLRQQDGLSYGTGAYLSASSFEPSGSVGVYAIFAPQNRTRVEQGLREELARFVQQGITAAELASARQAMLAGGNTRRANDGAVAQSWAAKLERDRSFAWDAAFEARLGTLTVPEVNAAIRRWIDPAKVNWSLAGDFGKQP